jgi:methylmalonyl-CoA/ethylmalonyl-CoA epimerase
MIGQLQLASYKLDHIGVVVDDFDKALDLWKKSFNVEVKPMEYQVPFSMTRGTPNPYTMKTAFVDMGPMRMELINIVQGETLHTQFLKNNGEGIHHLAFDVADLDKEVANAESSGLEMISYLKMPVSDVAKTFGMEAGNTDRQVMIYAYFDSTKTNGVMIEFIQENLAEKIKKIIADSIG